MKISTSMLGCDFLHLEQEIKKLENKKVDYIHIDLMDGHFVPNICLGFNIIADIKKITNIPFDVHLMLENPHEYIETIAHMLDGNSFITFHIESNSITKKAIDKIKALGIKAGLALNPKTPIERIKPFVNDVDLVLQMTVQPGYGGQQIIESAIEKCHKIKKMLPSNVFLEADGGINSNNMHILKQSGVDIIVMGSFFWTSHTQTIAEGLQDDTN